ncbi:hypothetical protein RB608_11900 [Nocardioides sp. LHD-245]|uniref:hypothetical protein n=1 Tax=Nocardioides sp. LHD-245 TaxID=3051387 RepID=UPI0027E001D8|nr:hypothetical protein [Nocardioides sp. LHD-245]
MTSCEGCDTGKVAYLSEYLASNAATLHTFLHPECTDARAYPCSRGERRPGDRHWHVGHKHHSAGERCKQAPPIHRRTHDPEGAA